MEYIYAVLLLHAAKKDISEDNIKRVLEAAGIAIDDIRLKALVAAVKEINIDDVLKSSFAMPVAPVTVQATQSAAAQQAQQPQKVEEKEEKKEGVSEEQLAEGLSALFG
ncbi:50S ribosomal protein P1 [Ignisphaera sp. 4213-co]|uniref:Large ribosomal subunit protein P1 n=1 Tax=Ignisphaera cupida TaxID=3050454 RepID=A0ABD4Z603_9CREN|nr:50S ribosomal protein P1 [Ignisphaera sp. 4213-co]MDK6028397.1 50S ribosomal protein P1 [Ignisphaera sp. 4213-co]